MSDIPQFEYFSQSKLSSRGVLCTKIKCAEFFSAANFKHNENLESITINVYHYHV